MAVLRSAAADPAASSVGSCSRHTRPAGSAPHMLAAWKAEFEAIDAWSSSGRYGELVERYPENDATAL